MTTQTVKVNTSVPDPTYNLVLVLQQALEDCFRYAHFAQDARDHDDAELADLFDELAEQDKDLAERLKKLLAKRLTN